MAQLTRLSTLAGGGAGVWVEEAARQAVAEGRR